MIYGGYRQLMDIGRVGPRFKDGKPRCYNCNTYGHMVRDCKKLKGTKCFRCGRPGHMAKDCQGTPIMKKRVLEGDEDVDEEHYNEEPQETEQHFQEGSN